jgi:hypothetical protein
MRWLARQSCYQVAAFNGTATATDSVYRYGLTATVHCDQCTIKTAGQQAVEAERGLI